MKKCSAILAPDYGTCRNKMEDNQYNNKEIQFPPHLGAECAMNVSAFCRKELDIAQLDVQPFRDLLEV